MYNSVSYLAYYTRSQGNKMYFVFWN